MTCLLGKLLLVIHMGVVGSVALRRLRKKMMFKRTSSSEDLNISVAIVFSLSTSRVAKDSGQSQMFLNLTLSVFWEIEQSQYLVWPHGQRSRAEAQHVAPPQLQHTTS